MPARHHIIAIIAFWLATTGWFFYRDLWPQWAPGLQSPFIIDLVDEASTKPIHWTVLKRAPDHDYLNKGYAETWVNYHEMEDMFDICGIFKLWDGSHEGPPDQMITSTYHVTREGNLRGLGIEVAAKVPVLGKKIEIEGRIDAPIRDGFMTPHLHTSKPLVFDYSMDSIALTTRGSVVNTMQPFNRLPRLRAGQRWRVPIVDPLTEAENAVAGSIVGKKTIAFGFLNAEVLPEHILPRLKVGKEKERGGNEGCLIIDYSGDEINARTWVRESDGMVLRQEVDKQGEILILDRDF